MRSPWLSRVGWVGAAAILVSTGWGQWRGGEQPLPDRSEFPVWEIPQAFENDVFTFARIQYSSRYAGRGGNRWSNDFPDSDWNFSYRLQELTSMVVDPQGRVLELTDPAIFDFPFLYMNGVGSLEFSQEEADCLRRHLLNGGFMMVDDFWGEEEWKNMQYEMGKVFPDRMPVDLPLTHPIFQLVYVLQEKPQVPDIRTWRSGDSFEYRHGSPGDGQPHFQAYHDDHDRIVALLCHNNDPVMGGSARVRTMTILRNTHCPGRTPWESTSLLTL